MMRVRVTETLEYHVGRLQEGIEVCRDIPRFIIYHDDESEDWL